MPKHYTERIVPEQVIPAHIEQVFQAISCCLCGVETSNKPYDDKVVDWEDTNPYTARETAVCMREAHEFPESGDERVRAYHICPECFREKLEPWILEQGGQVEESETSW